MQTYSEMAHSEREHSSDPSKLIRLIQNAKHILLSTHKQCDGDGLGAELGFFHALQKAGKSVELVHVDQPPPKYNFLPAVDQIEVFSPDSAESLNRWAKADLAVIFDTNDSRMIEPFASFLTKYQITYAFVDHHPLLGVGELPTPASIIDVDAASTGEVAYQLLETLGYPLDLSIAICLYTSIAFDTQLYRFIRNSPRSHEIASQLLMFPVQSSLIHERLFANHTVEKVKFLGHALGQIEFFEDGQIAFLELKEADLVRFKVQPDDVRDVIDTVMNIATLEAAAVVREDGKSEFKLSLRSKGRFPISAVAEHFGGGGHPLAAGSSSVKMPIADLKSVIVGQLSQLLRGQSGKKGM